MVRMTVMVALFFLGVSLAAAPPPQSSLPALTVLNRAGKPISGLVDGNSIQLAIKTQKQPRPVRVLFNLAPGDVALGECTIPAGGDTCKTEPQPSLGWAWGADGRIETRTVAAGSTDGHIEAAAQVRVMPRPVILAHGFLAAPKSWATWLGPDGYLASIGLHGYAVGDGQAEGKFSLGDLADPTGKTNTIAQNAEELRRYIAGVKQATGAEQVDLVGHSMGGLISRYYIDRLMPERDVAQLVMLGTPNTGSDCAALPASLGFYLPATLEIRSSYVGAIFDPQITRRHGVPFYAVAGTAIVEPVAAPCTNVPHDLAVSLDSVQGIPVELTQLPMVHTDLNISEKAFDVVKPILSRPAGKFTAAPDPAPPQPASDDLAFTRVFTGHLDAGSSQNLTIQIDSVSVASFGLFDSSRSLTVTVRGASGNVIGLDPVRNGLAVVDDPQTMVYLGYGFNNPKPGPWQVTLQTTDKTPSKGADYAITAQVRGGAKLAARASALLPPVNAPVELSARLDLAGQALPIRDARASIRRPDGGLETVALSPNGDEWKATWKPSMAGIYGVDMQVSGSAPDGSLLERHAFLTVESQPAQGEVQTSQTRSIIGLSLSCLVGLAAVTGLAAFLRTRARRGGRTRVGT